MWSKNKRGLLIPLFLFTALALIAVPALPEALSADDSQLLQSAPLNPAFQDYLQKMEIMPGGDRATAQEYSYGYRPPTVDLSHMESTRALNDSNMRVAAADYGALPVAFNWTAPTNRVTSVKDQNPCGTCWTFANTSVIESKVWIDGLAANQDFAEQALNCCMDPCWTTLAADRCNAGGNDFKAQDTFIKKGTRQETCQPYNTGVINTQACLTCPPAYQTTNFVWVAWDDNTTEARDAIKAAIQTYGPVTVAYYHNNAYLYSGARYYYTGDNATNHLVSIVGWDDTVTHPAGGGLGAWKTKNSWGTSFGDGGYFWLCYGKSRATEFGSLMGVKAYSSTEQLYYWDEAGWVSDCGYNTNTAWMANIFTASAAGKLTHVDFYSTDSNEQYDIRVYKSGDINSLGVAAATQVGVCSNAPGYYSIPLSTPVALSNGQAFTVVVKMTAPDYGLPLPFERVVPGCSPTIQTGKSYISSTGSGWTDLATSILVGNFCLRARVNSAHTMGDYNGDGEADKSVWRPNGGNWFVYPNFTPTQFGLSADVPVGADYNGDNTTEYAVWRPSDGNWFVYDNFTPTQFGLNGDIPVPADYSGDGMAEKAVWRPGSGNWYVYPSFTPTQFGLNGDIPVPADYDNDGSAEYAVWRPSTGNWYVYPSFTPTQFGLNGDIPVPADYNGDGIAEKAVWRPSTGDWYVYPNFTPTQFGLSSDIPVPGDYNGDGTAEFAVWRPDGGNWFVYPDFTQTQFGLNGDMPAAIMTPVRYIKFGK